MEETTQDKILRHTGLIGMIGCVICLILLFAVIIESNNREEVLIGKITELHEQNNELNHEVDNYKTISEIYSNEKCSIYDAYKDIYLLKEKAHGLYWKNTDFYCVWAKDRKLSNIEKTDKHEYCHYLIENNYAHFCE